MKSTFDHKQYICLLNIHVIDPLLLFFSGQIIPGISENQIGQETGSQEYKNARFSNVNVQWVLGSAIFPISSAFSANLFHQYFVKMWEPKATMPICFGGAGSLFGKIHLNVNYFTLGDPHTYIHPD